MTLFIAGQWTPGSGPAFISYEPATGQEVWQGTSASASDVAAAVSAAEAALPHWSSLSLEARIEVLEAYRDIMRSKASLLAELIGRENGKVLWDAAGEAAATANKVDISIQAYRERTPTRVSENGAVRTRLSHRPHGVMAVFGPYNFPVHLANGHIVPALLAGNTVVFKPSEQVPAVAEFMVRVWQEAGLPDGVLNLVHGGAACGQALTSDARINGVLFTGSVPVGHAIARSLADRPWVMQALELGGNNPLIVDAVADQQAAAWLTIQSAFITSGQRCTCARRLIVPKSKEGDAFIDTLVGEMQRIRVGAYNAEPEPFMGPLISAQAANSVMKAQEQALGMGARAVIASQQLVGLGDAFVSPGLVDVTGCTMPDEEVFGPWLQLTRTDDFESAVKAANATRFGLASGLISDDAARYDHFYKHARAGIVNWNQQLTGAASTAPFGGVGLSGNNRPSAYYAADYVAYAVASMEHADNKVAAACPKGMA